jgi:phospholipase C
MRRAWIAGAALAWPLVLAHSATAAPIDGIHNIQHVVVIMQENRTFDTYFGTYPGAAGIPHGVCVPDPVNKNCVAPFHNPADRNFGGPHGTESSINDINGGKMDGFIAVAENGQKCSTIEPQCSPCKEQKGACIDVMGYHDAREIPNYWTYAQNYVLQDNMFAPGASWSLPAHLFMVSGWSASCPNGDPNPMDCVGTLNAPHANKANYSWTDITYLLNKAHVSWRYYLFEGVEPDCRIDESVTCVPVTQGPATPGGWNPLRSFADVKTDGQLGNIQSLNSFYSDVQHQGRSCGLPNVSWIVPSHEVSEHPTALMSKGQTYVTTLTNAVMRSPCWNSTAIFVSWDDWGGFYDHVVPPKLDSLGLGIRVPGLVISAYARKGLVDHQLLSHDSYLKFIEDDFLGKARLNPATDGRPDARANVREESSALGDLASSFDFKQQPRPPLLLSPHPSPGPASNPP